MDHEICAGSGARGRGCSGRGRSSHEVCTLRHLLRQVLQQGNHQFFLVRFGHSASIYYYGAELRRSLCLFMFQRFLRSLASIRDLANHLTMRQKDASDDRFPSLSLSLGLAAPKTVSILCINTQWLHCPKRNRFSSSPPPISTHNTEHVIVRTMSTPHLTSR